MAGLLDLFGQGGTDSLGLLGMSPEDIKRARDDAQAQAMYALAGRLFQGGNLGQSVAQGLQSGQQAYKSTLNEQLGDKLQGLKLQELIRQQNEAKLAKQRQEDVRKVISGAYRPAIPGAPAVPVEEDGRYIGETPAVAARPASFDIQGAAPLLMATPEGRKALGDIASAQKAMAPEYKAVGDYLYQITPTGATQVAGQPKGPTSLQEFQAAAQNPAYAAFLREQGVLKAPKVAVDLKDPTAVAKARGETLKDWRGVLKDFGATEVVDRFAAASEAVAAGNAGNKSADGALIYAIGKIYDPSGAVQEGDKATIMGNRSIPETVKAYVEKATSGQGLLPSERAGLLAMARKVVEAKAENLKKTRQPYLSVINNLGGTETDLQNPFADVLSQYPSGAIQSPANLAAAAKAELARRQRK